jgi:WD40 repeat protein
VRQLACVAALAFAAVVGGYLGRRVQNRPLAEVAINRSPIGGIAFTQDGRYLVTSAVNELDVWSLPGFQCAAARLRSESLSGSRGSTVLTPRGDEVYCDAELFSLPGLQPRGGRHGVPVLFDPAGSVVVVGCSDGHFRSVARIESASTGAVVRELQGPSRSPVAFSPSGRLLATIVDDGEGHMGNVAVWSDTSARQATISMGQYENVAGLAFVSEDEVVAACGLEGLLFASARTGEVTKRFKVECTTGGGRPHVSAVVFDIPRRRLFWGNVSGSIEERSLDDGHLGWSKAGAHRNGIDVLALSPDGTLLASGAADCVVRVWRVH